MIEAKIIEDSLAPSGVRLTTYVLTYPRFIHSELMTHRVFSRNASSSRAIPFKKQVKMIEENIACPISYLANKSGMQGGEEIKDQRAAQNIWEKASKDAIKAATKLNDMGIHKQYVNRLLEPFSHITVVLSSTDYNNFFGLRYHSDAQPEIHELARQMYMLYKSSNAQELGAGAWHLPFVTNQDRAMLEFEDQIKKSVACCARVSYKNHDKTNPTSEENNILYDRLLGSHPIHASPAEHQAMAIGDKGVRSGNYRGWIQYRKTLNDENITEFTTGGI